MTSAVERQREYSRRSHAKHREKRNAYSREYAAKDPDAKKRRNAEYYAANREKELARAAAYRAANPERAVANDAKRYARRGEQERKRARDWRLANSEKLRELAARRRAHKARAVPLWADGEKTLAAYAEAQARSAQGPERFDVDHVVPLRSRLVCGLHVHTNLAVIPSVVNRYKSNTSWPDGPANRAEYLATIKALRIEGFL